MKVKRILAIILALCMVFSTMSFGAFAEEVSTLPEAVDGVITLTEDVTLSETFEVGPDESITIDLNGFTITGKDNTTYGDLAILGTASLTIKDSSNTSIGKFDGVVLNYGTLTIESGTVTSDSCNEEGIGCTIICQPNDQGDLPELNITGGTVKYTGDAILGMAICAYDTNGRVTELDISGGTITSTGVCVNAAATGTISGGTFEGKDLAALGITNVMLASGAVITGGKFNTDVSAYLADGYELDANGDVVKTTLAPTVATVDGVEYATFAEVLTAVKGSTGHSIVLLADVSASGQNALDALTGDTLDLNDKTLTVDGNSYFNDGTTTFMNGNIVVTGYASDSYFCGYTAGAVIVFDDVVITGDAYTTGCAIINANLGTVEIKNSAITVSGDTTGGVIYGGAVTIDNTDVTATNVCRGMTNSVAEIKNGSTFTFDGGETGLNNSTVTIDNSTVEIKNATKRAVRLDNNTLALQNSATLTATGCAEDIVAYDAASTPVVSVDASSTLNAVNTIVTNVAEVNGVEYATLAEAREAATNGETIEIIGDVVLDEQLNFSGYNYNYLIGKDASLTANTQRTVISYGNVIDVEGNIADAKTADKATTKKSMNVVEGLSFNGNGSGVKFNVNDAYVSFGSSSSKNSTATGEFNFNFTNSIAEFTSNFVMSLTKEGYALTPVFNINVKDSVLTTASHMELWHAGTNMTVDNSNVTVGGSFANGGTLTIKNGAVMNVKAPIMSSHGGNTGTINIDGATLDLTGGNEAWVSAGAINLTADAKLILDQFSSTGTITIDASDLAKGASVTVIDGTAKSGLTAESITLVNGGGVTLTVTDGDVVLTKETIKGSGTEADPYVIGNVEDLKWFRDEVNAGNDYAGQYFKLDADIDLAGENWTPIGTGTFDHDGDGKFTAGNIFKGNFDGGNHTISNLKIDEPNMSCVGLFGYAQDATFKNIKIKNVDIKGYTSVAAVVAVPMKGCSISNCHVSGEISLVADWAYVGGIASYGYVAVSDCSVIADTTGTIKSENRNAVGGIFGWLNENTAGITGCTVKNVDITGWANVGGIAGYVSYGNTVSGCSVENVNLNKTREDGIASIGLATGGWLYNANKTINYSNNNFKNMTLNGQAVPNAGANILYGGEYYGITTSNVNLENNTQVDITNNLKTVVKDATQLKAAIDAAGENATVILLSDIELSESVTVPSGANIVLDLNGKTITGTDNTTANFGLININPGAQLTVNDTVGTGKITLTATNNRGWGSYSAVISNQRGKVIVNGGTIEHLGGTDMAYGIDNLTNGKGTYAETVINDGTVKSTYRAIRQFLNGTEAQNILTVNGGTIEGANKSIWMQDPNKNANTGSLTVSEDAVIKGDINLTVTAGSTEWPVEVSIAAEALDGESTVLTSNVPAHLELRFENGVYGVAEKNFAEVNGVGYTTLQAAIDAAGEGETVTLVNDVTLTETVVVAAGQEVVLDLNGKTVSMTDASGKAASAIKNNGTLTIEDSAENGKITFVSSTPSASFSYSTSTVVNSGNLVVNGGTVENTTNGGASYAIDTAWYSNDISVTINGGTIKSAKTAIRQVPFSATAKNVLTVNGGTIEGGYAAVQTHSFSSADAIAEVNINGGTLSGVYAYYTYYSHATGHAGTDIEIIDGTFNGYVYIYNGNAGSAETDFAKVSVSGGTFNGGVYVYTKDAESNEAAIGAITGGTFDTDVSTYLAEGYSLYANANDPSLYSVSETRSIILNAPEEVNTGETFDVKVFIDTDDIMSVKWTLDYDSNYFTLASTTIGGNVSGKYQNFAPNEAPEIMCQNGVIDTTSPVVTYTFTATKYATTGSTITLENAVMQNATESIEDINVSVDDASVTIKTTIDYVVEVGLKEYQDYVAGTKLVLVYSNAEGVTFDFNGVQMFDVTGAGYKYEEQKEYAHVYALVVEALSEHTLDAYEAKVTVDYEGTAPVVTYDKNYEYNAKMHDNDVNISGAVNWNDIISVYAVAERNEYAFRDAMNVVLKADVNGDKVVDTQDASPIINEVYDR